MSNNAVQVAADEPPAVAQSEAAALIGMIERLALNPNANIETIERMIGLRERVISRQSEVAFNAAMAEVQAALIPVIKNATNKHTQSKYADLAAIAEAAMPVVHKHGFGLSFSEFKSTGPDCIGIACKITHSAGHSERYEFNVPVDGAGMRGAANKTATQAYGSTATYGRRYATCMVFNIATKDNDGNKVDVNPLISKGQVETLQKLIEETKSNLDQFLALGKVESLADITTEAYARALGLLQAKKAKMLKNAQENSNV